MQIFLQFKYTTNIVVEYWWSPAANAIEDDVDSSPICPFLDRSLELLLPVVNLGRDDNNDDNDDDDDDDVFMKVLS